MHHEIITWDSHEYHHFEKNADWYWSLGIIAVSIAILCILFNNLLFAAFIIVGAIAGALYAAREPELAHVELRPHGVKVNNIMYTYHSLESFWVEEFEHPEVLILKSKHLLMPYIIVHLSHVHPDDIRVYLRMHLKEVEHHESLIHKLFEYLGF